MLKFISWNVNGLRAIAGKGFADIFAEFDADFFCLQETKMQAGQLELEFLFRYSRLYPTSADICVLWDRCS